jgi:hypothetical protein
MAATILSGTQTPTGNFTLYTNNTSGNVRLIIHHLFIHGQTNNTIYSTRRVDITGGSHGTVSFPSSHYHSDPSLAGIIQRVRVQTGKGLSVEDNNQAIFSESETTPLNIYVNGCVRTVIAPGAPGSSVRQLAEGPQSFPTEILMRPGQSMVFVASTSTSKQYFSFNITVMPEDG